jgi:hypothetical protein
MTRRSLGAACPSAMLATAADGSWKVAAEMAKIVNVSGKVLWQGSVAEAVARMELSQLKHAKMKPKDQKRYAAICVRAAIRRGGMTDADQRLVMSAIEREQWELDNPLPED